MAEESINGIVVFCTDPRTKNANLWKHIKNHLIPPDQRLAPVGLFGAPVALARPADFPIKFAAVMEDIGFALKKFAKGRFVVVGHDCGIYTELTRSKVTLGDKMNDIAIAADFLRGRFPGMPVSAFFKKSTSGFEEIR